MSTQWIISPIIQPLPSQAALNHAASQATDPIGAVLYLSKLVGLRLTLQRDHLEDGYGDIEDFIERTARTQQALDTVGRDHLWFDHHDGTMSRLGERASHPIQPLLPRIGSLQDYSFCRTAGTLLSGTSSIEIPSQSAVDQYFDSEVFLQENNRHALVCDTTASQLRDAICAVLPFSENRSVWIKARASKSYLLQVRIPEGFENLSPDAAESALYQLFDVRYEIPLIDVFFSYENQVRGLLVAPHVPMTREYRVFLVDGVPVTGAGCIEEDTPLKSSATSPFSLRMQRVRGESHTRTDNHTLLMRYINTAARLGAQLQAEGRGTCVIDLAHLEDGNGGEIVIVELNSITNAGFYASNIELLYARWAEHPELFTPVLEEPSTLATGEPQMMSITAFDTWEEDDSVLD